MYKFIAGETYSCRSVCDHNCIWAYNVQRRSAKTVWIWEVGAGRREDSPTIEVKARRITVYKGEETVFPKGRYSMAPILSAASPLGLKAMIGSK